MRLTIADVKMFAASIGLSIEGDPAAAADELGEALDWYVTDVRIQKTNSEQATAPEWGDAVAKWAAEGRILLGDRGRDDDLTRASFHLSNALPTVGLPEEYDLLYYVLIAREQHFYYCADGTGTIPSRTREEFVSSILETTIYALRALQILGDNIDPRLMHKGKRVDRARLNLVSEMARVFAQLFPTTPFTVLTRVKSEALLSERRVFSDGPALCWCQMILEVAPDRLVKVRGEIPPEIVGLRQWAAKPDGLSKVIRKLNAFSRPKSAEEKR